MRILTVVAALMLVSGPVYSQRKRAIPKPVSPPKVATMSPRPAPNAAGVQNQNHRQMLDRLEQMSPQQRQKLLQRLPPERAQKLQERLDRYDRMPPEQRERLRQQYEWFRQLPPDQQQGMRRAFNHFSNLPQNRQEAVRQEFNNLRGLNEAERQARIQSPGFRARYSREEQRVIEEMSGAVPE